MDVMFNWMTGQEAGQMGRGSYSAASAKNAFSVHVADGRTLMVEAQEQSGSELERTLEQMMGGMAMASAGQTVGAEVAAGLLRGGLYWALQEEEWGTGQTLSTMPATFQGVVHKYMRGKKEGLGRLVDVAGVIGRGRRDGRQAKAGDVVGLYMKRSEMLVRLVYSVVWQGLAFLPLDSDFSFWVLEFRLQDSDSACCLSDLSNLHPSESCIVSLFLFNFQYWGCHETDSDKLCYILYTSGTTGLPKGVLIRQGNVISSLMETSRFLEIPLLQTDVHLFQNSISFDSLIYILALHINFNFAWKIVSDSNLLGSSDMKGVSVAFFVPSQLQLIPSLPRSCLTSLQCIFCAGESLSAQLVFAVREKREVRVFNLYGPTETVCGVTGSLVSRSCLFGSVPIGRPWKNVNLSKAKIDLTISGFNVGAGYQKQLSKSQLAFIYDQFSNDGSSRSYRTRDQSVFNEDGQLIFTGRKDGQVKINGKRLELAGVENAIMGVPGVIGCAVFAVHQETRSRNLHTFLIAFIATRENSGVTAHGIKTFLTGKVSRHEIPWKMVIENMLPVTLAGKVDRKKLEKKISSVLLDSRKDCAEPEPSSANNRSRLHRSDSRSLVTKSFESLTGRTLDPARSLWDQGLTSLNATLLEESMKKEIGASVSLSQLLKDGSLDGIADALDSILGREVRQKAQRKKKLEDESLTDVSTGITIRKFPSVLKKIALIISSFGM